MSSDVEMLTKKQAAEYLQCSERTLDPKGYVYFIRSAGPPVLIKIGYSADPAARLKELQVGSPLPLSLIALWPGTLRDEAALHKRFARQRVRGEWFRSSKDLRILFYRKRLKVTEEWKDRVMTKIHWLLVERNVGIIKEPELATILNVPLEFLKDCRKLGAIKYLSGRPPALPSIAR